MQELTMVPVDRLEKPPLEEFRRYTDQEKPVVITGAMSDWKALSTWTTEYLENKVGNTQVPVIVTAKGQTEGRFFYQGTSKSAEVQMRECLGLLRGERPRVYMAAVPMTVYVPSLIEDIQVPDIIPHATRTTPQLWISGNGSIGPLHYDLSNNIHILVRGRKRFRLFDFEQTSNLYPNSVVSFSPSEAGAGRSTGAPGGIREELSGRRLLAGVLIDKFLYHLPLYRQHQRLLQTGIRLSRGTLTHWVQRTAALLGPIYYALLSSIL